MHNKREELKVKLHTACVEKMLEEPTEKLNLRCSEIVGRADSEREYIHREKREVP